MDGLALTLWPMTAWHWLAVGLILLSIEMAVGTFDLLWIAIAAAITSAFAAFAPAEMANWQGQLIVFAIASTVLFVIGRTVLRGLRENIAEHPTLNKRMAGTLGEHATVTADFQGGAGRVKLGDTEWSAEAIDEAPLKSGDRVVVTQTEGNILKVTRA